MENSKSTAGKRATAGQPTPFSSRKTQPTEPAKPAVAASPPPAPPVPPALFRRLDWFTFWLVTLVTLAGYLLTVAPDLTLEDSGELAVGSMYAGVPHPPGYPVWTLYTWVFTKLLPFSNIAWRVSVSSAFAAAFACGICALLISRGSSMLLEGIAWFENLDPKWESRICVTSGFVGGALLGFNGYIWSQAVIVEVYTLSVLSLMLVLAFLLRWIHAPDQRKYLYWAFFWFGISFCNHQTLIVAAIGIEIAVAAANPKLGRDAFWFNTLCWVFGLIGHGAGKLNTFADNPQIFFIFNLIGVLSATLAIWLTLQTRGFFSEWKTGLICFLAFLFGALFYFYMPLASMTNPPMNWGYPRTWDGFLHAFTRGQYEKTAPGISIRQIWMYVEGCAEEFNFANLLIGLVPFLFLLTRRLKMLIALRFTKIVWRGFFRTAYDVLVLLIWLFAQLIFPSEEDQNKGLQKREHSWLLGLSSIYVCLSLLLLYLLNPTTEKQSQELVKVFFTSSHVVIALAIGYGLTLVAGCLLCRFQETRYWLLVGGAVACAVNLYDVVTTFQSTLFLILRTATVLSLVLAASFLLLVLFQRQRARLAPFLIIFSLVPLDSILSHWSDNEQRGHLFGFWFGHDMFDLKAIKGKDGKPLYPDMDQDTVLFGGTDPGRFCPTYMIFCESFLKSILRRDPSFDRRDVYLITQNALADPTYLNYIRAHYNRSAQPDPPFFQEMVRGERNRTINRTNLLMKVVKPLDTLFLGLGARVEKERRAGSSFFTTASFSNFPGFATRLNTGADPLSKFLKESMGPASSGSPRDAAAALNKVIDAPPIYDPNRFAGVKLTERTLRFVAQKPTTPNRIRLNRLLLEEAYPEYIVKSLGGLYPDLEIITPSPEDSQRAFNDYMLDAQRRMVAKQLKGGELVQQTPDGRVSVSGQVAVMSINALLCKVIFDKNPHHEFYIEESFPLDWMYEHLTPFGIIMKINRQPVPELTGDMLDRDHEFWSQYSDRLIGNWITYDTPVKEVCEFALRVYQRHDFKGFKGDPKFIRDDNAQKSFSKLRGAIGGVYAWRIDNSRSTNEQQRVIKEADFAYKQSFAYCPYSPEAVIRYINYLVKVGRLADAVEVAKTCYAFDEENIHIGELAHQLEQVRANPAMLHPPPAEVGPLEARFQAASSDAKAAFDLVAAYSASGRQTDAYRILDGLVTNPATDASTMLTVAEAYRQLNNIEKMEAPLMRYAPMMSNSAEAWYDLAAIQAALGKALPAAENAARAFALSDRRMKTNAQVRNLREKYRTDPRFDAVRKAPEFQPYK